MRKAFPMTVAAFLLATPVLAADVGPAGGAGPAEMPWAFAAAQENSRDLDGDGIGNRRDECPSTPVGARVDRKGCPVDTDEDGVADGIDHCSRTPAGWPVDEHGCPRDADRDQVADGEDICGHTPQGARVNARGCPVDSDADGTPDGLDRCDATPGGATVDARGCPSDVDHDGVPDVLDRCPDTWPTLTVDSAGCHQKAPNPFEAGDGKVIMQGVTFEPNVIELTPESIEAVESLAAALKDWPDLAVEIGAYTDSRGSAARNLELSLRRAEYIRSYLIAKGIDPSRISSKAYGEKNPIADNKTEEGRKQNRRVELTRLERSQVASQAP